MNFSIPFPTKVELSIYKIKNCGLYTSWGKPPVALNIKDLLSQLERWGIKTKKPLDQTSVYTPSSDLLASYLWGVEHDSTTGNYLIGFWNEIENKKGAVSYASGNAAVGDGVVTEAKGKKGDIPGYLSLFWFIPSKQIIVGIRTEDHINTGINQLRAYLLNFGIGFSEQVIRTDPTNRKHTAFTDQPKDFKAAEDKRIPNSSLKPSFRFPPLQLKGEINFIKKHVLSVTKLIRKVKVKSNTSKGGIVEKVMEGIDFLFHSSLPTENRFIKVEYPTRVSGADVNYMLKDYVDNNMADSYDVTFVFSGDIPNKSFSGARAVEKVSNFNMYYKSKDTPNLTKLLNELDSKFIAHIDKSLAKV